MFGIQPPFSTDESYTEETLKLLNSVTLGSNGARYKHIGIEKRTSKLHNPLFLNLTLRNKLKANVTFCRRDKDWYVRYFAFDQTFQASSSKNKKSKGRSKLNDQLRSFFESALQDKNGPDCFYAYIDPKNERSLWMSEAFGFEKKAKVATQTFSRLKPNKGSLRKLEDVEQIKSLVDQAFSGRPYYHPQQTFKGRSFYVLEKNEEVVAFANSYQAEWKIERIPGKRGKLLTKLIPYIPIINKIIRPDSHRFSVIDSVWVKQHNTDYFQSLAEGILAEENHKVLHWWVDQKESLWNSLKDTVNWGVLHKINGVHEVDLVVRTNKNIDLKEPAYISGFDFV
jgi:hypothetical protein